MGIPLITNPDATDWMSKIEGAVDYYHGSSVSDGIDDFGDARTLVNAACTGLGLPTVESADSTATKRSKINAMIQALGVPEGLDLYADFVNGRYWDDGGESMLAEVTDTWSGGLVETPTGYSNVATNVLARSALGLQTVPTYEQFLPNVTTMIGSGWANGAAAAASPFTAPDGGQAIRLTDSNAAGYSSNNIVVALGADALPRYISVFVRKTADVRVFGINLTFQGPGSGLTAVSARLNTQTGQVAFFSVLPSPHSDYWRIGLSFTNNNSGYTSFALNFYPTPATAWPNVDSPAATGFADIWAPNVTTSAVGFLPPIVNSGAAVLRNGNRQVIDLTGRLAYGVAGFLKLDIRQPHVISGTPRLLEISDGTGNNRFSIYSNTIANQMGAYANKAGLAQASQTIETAWQQGVQTIAFAVGPNFFKARRVGGADYPADTVVDMPDMNMLAIGGMGYNSGANLYQFAKKLGLIFGSPSQPVNQALFDQVYAMAVAA